MKIKNEFDLIDNCKQCNTPLFLTNKKIFCKSCSYELIYRCPICNAQEKSENNIDNEKFHCSVCKQSTSLSKIQSIINNRLNIDYNKTCTYCNSPTLHRKSMNIGNRCFHYPSCNGQTSLFEDKKESFVFLDFETSGLEVMKEEIIEIGAYKIDDDGVESFYQSLVKPSKAISETITSITHITNAMLENAANIKDALSELCQFMKGSTVVVHNAEFDILWLLHNCEKLHINNYIKNVICTLEWAKNLEEKTLSLQRLTKKYNITHNNAHRALSDAASTRDLFFIFLEQKKKIYNTKEIKFYQNLYENLKSKYTQFTN